MWLWKKFCNIDIIGKIIILVLLFIIIVATITVITRYRNASIETQANDVNIVADNNIESDNAIIENNIAENKDSINTSNTIQNDTNIEETTQVSSNQKSNKNESSNKSIVNSNKNNEKKVEVKEETNTKSNTTNNEQIEKQENSNSKENTQNTKPKVQINLDKYDRYDKLSNGYRGFSRNATEITKLRTLINQAIDDFGYTDVQIKEDKSIISDRYFTANKVNVENAVYNSDGFTIYYYAESEYHVDPNGTESLFQVRSYIKVK